MKITLELPDNAVLVTIALVTQDRDNPFTVRLGMNAFGTEHLIDGNTVDCRPKESEGKE